MAKIGEKLGFTFLEEGVTKGGVLKGVGAIYAIDSQTNVILMSPDRDALKRAVAHLLPNSKFEDWKASEAFLALDASEVQINESLKEIWIVHPESECAFRGYEKDIPGHDGCCSEIGPVEKGTILECKILLRGLGWDREDINKLRISDLPADEIPF